MSRKLGSYIFRLVAACVLVGSAAPSVAAARPTPLIAYRDGWNVYLMDAQGSARRAITTDGRGYNATFYPWYQWSPDGKYLLLVRVNGALHTTANVDLVVVQPTGSTPRTLVSGVVLGDFFPSWALDGNQIIYTAAQRIGGAALQTRVTNMVSSVDVTGHSTVLWHYDSLTGCGGGTPVPSEQLRWEQVGPLGIPRTMQWSLAQHLAVYSASCSRGLNVTDTTTGRTQRLDPAGMAWSAAVLSPQGKLAVVNTAPATGAQSVLVTSPRAGAPYRTVGPGELPAWSSDGQTLYFVSRTLLGEFPFTSPLSGAYAAQVYASAVWSARADGSQPALVLTQPAYGFGPLQVNAPGAGLIYSSVDNMTALAYHLAAGHMYTASLLQQYGPKVHIERYVPGSGVTTVLRGGSNPTVQPS